MTAPRALALRDRASAIDRLNVGFLAIVVVIALAALPRLPHPVALFASYAALLGVIHAAGRLRDGPPAPWRRTALFVYAALFMFAIFETFALVMPYFRAARYDAALARLDLALFGVHPTVWMQQFATPWRTELLYTLYLFYFPMPLLILVPMFRRAQYEDLERWIVAFLCCYYGAYLIYFFIPAEGPRFHPPPGQSPPLTGLLLTAPIRALVDSLEPNKLDAFPSLHAGILTMTMLLAWHEARRTFWIFLPIAAGITISLVYCRYHYAIDVFAGVAWALLVYAIAMRWQPRLRAGSAPHFGDPRPGRRSVA